MPINTQLVAPAILAEGEADALPSVPEAKVAAPGGHIKLNSRISNKGDFLALVNQLHQSPSQATHESILQLLDFTSIHGAELEQNDVRQFLSVLAGGIQLYREYPHVVYPLCVNSASHIGRTKGLPVEAATLMGILLRIDATNLEANIHFVLYLQDSGKFDESIEASRALMDSIKAGEGAPRPLKLFATYLCMRALMMAGDWLEVKEFVDPYINGLIEATSYTPDEFVEEAWMVRTFNVLFWIPYVRHLISPTSKTLIKKTLGAPLGTENDGTRLLMNQITANMAQALREKRPELAAKCEESRTRPKAYSAGSKTKIKLGFLSHNLYRHSVGWLSRWLIGDIDKEKFDIHLFIPTGNKPDALYQGFCKFGTAHHVGSCGSHAAQVIHDQDLDALVDMSSLTLDVGPECLSYRPSRNMISWLGWDAPGICDHMIVDPYIIEKEEGQLYHENLLVMPNTYIAVRGFEQSAASLSRRKLGISDEDFVFLVPARGFKLNPMIVKMHVQVLRETKRSVILIKSLGDHSRIQKVYEQEMEENGIEKSRLKFCPILPMEEAHRGNLHLADAVLDSFPYSGATTSLECLWAGLPIVTLAGDHFSSRATMSALVNCGLIDLVAYSPQQYVEKAVKMAQGIDGYHISKFRNILAETKKTSAVWDVDTYIQDFESMIIGLL